MKNYLVVLSTVLLLSACVADRQPVVEDAGGKTTAPVTSAPATSAVDLNVPSTAAVTTSGLTDSAKAASQQGLQDKSVYFDFNMYVVKPEYRALLQQHVAILNANLRDSVTLEGNSDERGSSEYNLALGSKRATVVKTQLVLMGIAAARIREVSFGEEKPRAFCHDETCWQKNRRVDFVYRSN